MSSELARYEGASGVWVLYDYGNDGGPEAKRIEIDPVKIIESLGIDGVGKIAFWPMGFDFIEAVKDWNNKNRV